MDTGLGGAVQGDLLAGVGFIDDGADGGSLRHRYLGPVGPPGNRRPDDFLQQTRLAVEAPVDRLYDDAGLGRDGRQGGAGVPADPSTTPWSTR